MFRILSPGKVALAVAILTVFAAWAIVRAGDDPNEDLTTIGMMNDGRA